MRVPQLHMVHSPPPNSKCFSAQSPPNCNLRPGLIFQFLGHRGAVVPEPHGRHEIQPDAWMCIISVEQELTVSEQLEWLL